ncbi:MAG: DUF4340 domain-containing protein [Saprospiraceae bacterium]|jgi:hypothetical protein|nr:DUF4340 domain-containing protein [Saprospiraceae bacterium]
MKKNYWLIAIFLLLGGFTAWYVLSGKKDEKSTLGWDRQFKVPVADIEKIFIAKRTGETTTIERDGDAWKVNGKWKAGKNITENLLEAVSNIELQYVPPPAALESLTKELASRGIKVEVYGKGGKKLKAYYIGGVTTNAEGTVAIMEGAEQPMVVHIPNMVGQIRTRYDSTGDDWRDKNIFSYKPEDIEAVSIEYPQQRNQSFRLFKNGSNWDVKPFYDNTPPSNKPVVKGKVEGFLMGFEALKAESFENTYAKKDSIRQMIPFSIVSVTDKKGEQRKAAFYPTFRLDKYTGERRSDIVERYFADVSTGDWMLTQHGVFKKIFWSYDAFF